MANYEALYTVEQREGRYYITGFTERKAAEKFGVRHLTVIIVPFIRDIVNIGKWIVHDRTAKQWAKGKLDCKSPSYNLYGGHCTADTSQLELVGAEIPMEICISAAKRELEEELLWQGQHMQRKHKQEKQKQLEVWADGVKTEKVENAALYKPNDLIPIGFASYEDKDNVELSYVFALPIPCTDVCGLISADNYMVDGVEHNIHLPGKVLAESDLQAMWQTNPDIEICDAITRLWNPENEAVLDKLHETIDAYILKDTLLRRSKPK